MLITSSPDNLKASTALDQELGMKFSHALCHYIKREVNNALMRNNRLPLITA
jgi:hypothetical protein